MFITFKTISSVFQCNNVHAFGSVAKMSINSGFADILLTYCTYSMQAAHLRYSMYTANFPNWFQAISNISPYKYNKCELLALLLGVV